MNHIDRHCYKIETPRPLLDKIASILLACAIGISFACVILYSI